MEISEVAVLVKKMCGGVASRLGEKVFDDLLAQWLRILKASKFVTFIGGSVAKRLEDPDFVKSLYMYAWLDALKPAKFATVTSRNGLGKRLAYPNFGD